MQAIPVPASTAPPPTTANVTGTAHVFLTTMLLHTAVSMTLSHMQQFVSMGLHNRDVLSV